jgi:hypothetical protein
MPAAAIETGREQVERTVVLEDKVLAYALQRIRELFRCC